MKKLLNHRDHTGHNLRAMDKMFLVVVCFAFLFGAAAKTMAQEQVLKIYSGGSVLLQKKTTEMDSIKSDGNTLRFFYDGGSQSFARNSVDSVAFAYINTGGQDTSDVDTASCVYITWNGSSVSVVNPFSNRGLTVNTNGATVSAIAMGNVEEIVYRLRGSSTNGSFNLSTDRKFTIMLDGLTLTNPSGPAIKVITDYRGIVHLVDGTENSLCDGASSAEKGALQSKGRFVFQGGGTLNVTGLAKHGIQTSGSTTVLAGNINVLGAVKDGMNVDNFIVRGGSVNVVSSGDGIDADQGYIDISGGTVTVNCASDDVKGLAADSVINISGGEVDVTVSGAQSKGIKTKDNMTIRGGTVEVHANGSVVMEPVGNGYDPSYCTGVKVDGVFRMLDGVLTVVCPNTNAGGKAVSCVDDVFISGGTMNLTATGSCVKYLDSTNTYDSYKSTCLKGDANIYVSGGTVNCTAGGRAIAADGNYAQTGGHVTTSTSASGFTTIGTGTSCSDGFAAACLNCDGHVSFTQGYFSGSSTGTGGRGIVADATLTIGETGAADSLLFIYVTTTGNAVNGSSGGGWPGGGGSSSDYWKGLPKAVKINDTITVNSGVIQSYCAQNSGDPTGEAIESKTAIFFNGGYVEANAYDDAINAGTYIAFNGSHVWAYSRGNDAIDCNGVTLYVNDGVIVCRGSETGFDDNSDRGGHMYVTGGTVVSVGGNMGSIEGTPTMTNQKYLTLGSNSGGGWPGGGGSGSTLASNGFCIKNNDATQIIMTFKWPTVSGNGFQMSATPSGAPAYQSVVSDMFSDMYIEPESQHKTKPEGPTPTQEKRVSGIFVTSPLIQSGTYRYFTSPSISGGTHWHGLYDGASVSTSGEGTTTTAY